jgi:hypothetical protein
LFSINKYRVFLLQRVKQLNDNGIKPTLKRVVFLQRALAYNSKRQLFSHAEQADAACSLADRSGADHPDHREVAGLEARMNQQQEAFQKQVQHMLQQQQQQQQEAIQEQHKEVIANMQQQMQELRSQLQKLKHDQ